MDNAGRALIMRRANHFIGEGKTRAEATRLAWREAAQGRMRERIYARLGLTETAPEVEV